VRERGLGAMVGLFVIGLTYLLIRVSGGWFAVAGISLVAGWLVGGRIHRLTRLAQRDPLTGISNRRAFERALTQEWERSCRTGRPVSLLFIDIDDFGPVNKLFGHLMGDEVLKAVTRQVRGSLRRYDVVARYGGEEFVVLLPETDMSHAATIAERIRAIVQQTAVRDKDRVIAVTVSMGVASYPGSARSPRDLLRQAIAGQQKAKSHKNTVSIVS
jgi:two-component system, sensor histidine kinase LadS